MIFNSIKGEWGASHMMRSGRSNPWLDVSGGFTPSLMRGIYRPADIGKRDWNSFFRALRKGKSNLLIFFSSL